MIAKCRDNEVKKDKHYYEERMNLMFDAIWKNNLIEIILSLICQTEMSDRIYFGFLDLLKVILDDANRIII